MTDIAYCIFVALLAFFVLMKISNIRHRFMDMLELVGLSIPLGFFIKTALQFFFGRTAPLASGSHVLSFISHPHTFSWLNTSGGCFPSGHMTLMSGLAVGFCLHYRRIGWILLWTALSLILAGLLIGLNYHYLSDVIAGTFLGTSISTLLYILRHKGRSHHL
jgi:membrane-associated phospholipid phosphatase